MIAGEAATLARTVRLSRELRRAGIGDPRVLGAIEKIPRAVFVPAALADRAHDNVALPIGCGQTISQPYVVALMTERLELDTCHTVLEIGTGSGYQAAILSQLARRVLTLERHAELLRAAERRFGLLQLGNIVCRLGDGAQGWPEEAPFDRVIVTAAAPEVPAALIDALAPGGILLAPVGEDGSDQVLVRIRRGAAGFSSEDLGLVRFVPLVTGMPSPAGDAVARE